MSKFDINIIYEKKSFFSTARYGSHRIWTDLLVINSYRILYLKFNRPGGTPCRRNLHLDFLTEYIEGAFFDIFYWSSVEYIPSGRFFWGSNRIKKLDGFLIDFYQNLMIFSSIFVKKSVFYYITPLQASNSNAKLLKY